MTAATDTFRQDSIERFAIKFQFFVTSITECFPSIPAHMCPSDISEPCDTAIDMLAFAHDFHIIDGRTRMNLRILIKTIAHRAESLYALRHYTSSAAESMLADMDQAEADIKSILNNLVNGQ